MQGFGLTGEEMSFLLANVRADDRVFEWGSGETTWQLAKRCRHVTTVEHQVDWAVVAVANAARMCRNASVIYAPPDLPYVEGTEDDGDLATFRTYVESYTGRGIDVVLVDGRARIEAVRYAVERAPFGPDPAMRFLLHDCERPQYAPIFEMLREESRVGRLALLRVRTL